MNVTANAEVLLAAGSINSRLGVTLRREIPGIGENLQDHLQIRTVYKISNAKTLNTMANSLVAKARMGLQYLLTQSGPLSMAPSQLGMFSKSDRSLATPDLEYHVQPLSTDRLGDPLHTFPAITVSVCNLRPQSVGSCHAVSTSSAEQSDIRLNYRSAKNDKHVAVRSIRQTRDIMAASALRPYQPKEILPGPTYQSDSALLKQVGNIATTIFHPVGTCKIGNDQMSVVGADLRVHGLDGLRVVDASIMPRIVSGNTASPVVMIAEKVAHMIQRGRS